MPQRPDLEADDPYHESGGSASVASRGIFGLSTESQGPQTSSSYTWALSGRAREAELRKYEPRMWREREVELPKYELE